MGRWRGFWRSLRAWQKVTLAAIGIICFLFVFFAASFETVHYTESTEFCSSCHSVMDPEIVTHSISAHANVDCGECHMGPGIMHKLYYKFSAVRYLWTLPLGIYSRPLASARPTMRTTDVICEQCHTPEGLQAVAVRSNTTYAPDEQNSAHGQLMALKVGNGEDIFAGSSQGAHWHVTHTVYYSATDPSLQEIPWVQVDENGELVTYVSSDADPAFVADAEANKVKMDCIDCHSRDGHMVPKPADAIDNAIANNLIPADLPYVKAQSSALLDQHFESKEKGLEAIHTTLQDFYQTQYPDLYAQRQIDVGNTISQVQTIFQHTQFPYMHVYWDTYPDPIGHKDFPGCFRCHDGNHFNEQGEVISAECNLCHTIPQEGGPDKPLTLVSQAQNEIPKSHQSSLWIAEHRFQFDATCDDCHTISDPGGTSNSSFCSNSGCHAGQWTNLKIDAPAVLAQVVPKQQPSERKLPRIPHPIVNDMDCRRCHGPEKVQAYPEDHADYGLGECSDCHRLSKEVLADLPPATATVTPTATAIPMISHTLMGNENCLACHAVGSNIAPAPVTHSDFTNEMCQRCHILAPEFATLPTATVTVVPMSTPLPAPTVTVTRPVTAEASPTLPAQTPTEATPAGAVTTSVSPQASAILHPVEGNENCLACHAVSSTIEPAPPNHAGLTADLCQSCHLPAAAAMPKTGPTVTVVP